MTVELIFDQETFQAHIESLFNLQNKTDALSRLRLKGWDQLISIGLPTRQIEAYQYLPLTQLFSKKFALPFLPSISSAEIKPYILPECQESVVVFVNGKFDPLLSCFSGLPKKAVFIPLHEAWRSFSSLMQNQVTEKLNEEKDPFAALNAAFIDQAFFLYLPPQTILELPLQILHVIQGSKQLLTPRVECFFGAQSQAHVISTVAQLEGQHNFHNSLIHFSLEEGSQINFERVFLNSSPTDWHFDATRAHLKRDASLKTVIVQNGSQCYRDDYRIALLGPNAEAHLNGVSMLNEKKQSHTHVLMEHHAPACRSLQLFKEALAGFSHASFEGKIYVKKEAQKTQAFQLNNFLLLSDYARSESKPNLEIFADDVKASHGATIGQLNADELFYLQTRGLKESAAKNLLTRGFCHEVIDLLSPTLKLTAAQYAAEYL